MPAHFQSRIIMGGLIALALAGAFYTFFGSSLPGSRQGTACPADARQCPDGTYVGRTGPACEFATCPSGVPSAEVGPVGTVTGQLSLGATTYVGTVEARNASGALVATAQSNTTGTYVLKLAAGEYQITARGTTATVQCARVHTSVKTGVVATANIACTSGSGAGKPFSVEVSTGFAQAVTAGPITITPMTLIEDSRCPVSVQCIQAGTVRIKAMVKSASGTSEMTLALGTPSTTEAETITLIGVYPGKSAGKTVPNSAYQFTFHVASR